jgi:hypothetical protein
MPVLAQALVLVQPFQPCTARHGMRACAQPFCCSLLSAASTKLSKQCGICRCMHASTDTLWFLFSSPVRLLWQCCPLTPTCVCCYVSFRSLACGSVTLSVTAVGAAGAMGRCYRRFTTCFPIIVTRRLLCCGDPACCVCNPLPQAPWLLVSLCQP